jgi:hypothetical protein
MKPGLLNLFSALSILILDLVSRSNAQTPQRDNRPRTASIGFDAFRSVTPDLGPTPR